LHRGEYRPHPKERSEVRIEREAIQQFAQLIHQLDFPDQWVAEQVELTEFLAASP